MDVEFYGNDKFRFVKNEEFHNVELKNIKIHHNKIYQGTKQYNDK